MEAGYPVYRQSVIFDEDCFLNSKKELEGIYETLNQAEAYIDAIAVMARHSGDVNFVCPINNPDVYGIYRETDQGIYIFYIGQKCVVLENKETE